MDQRRSSTRPSRRTRTLAALGAVALTATTAVAAQEAAAALAADGIDARGYALDVTDRAQVDDVVGRAAADLGTVDVLVNNAGISIGGAALEIDDEIGRASCRERV